MCASSRLSRCPGECAKEGVEMDPMIPVTSSEAAGFAVGGFLLAVALAAPKVDAVIARSQRRALKLCEDCGGVGMLPCKKCKGEGELKPLFSPFRQKNELSAPQPCPSCRGKGQLNCPSCVTKMVIGR